MLKITSLFTRLFSLICALALLIGAPPAVSGGTPINRPADVRTEVNVISDIHMEGNNNYRKNLYVRALRNMDRYTNADALVMCGDNTMNGFLGEYYILNGITARLLPNVLTLPVVGNHDLGNGADDFSELSARYISQYNAFHTNDPIDRLYYARALDGCRFIALANETDNDNDISISAEQLQWFEAQLDAAEAAGVPSIVVCHFPLNYLDYDVRELIEEHRNVCFFSGHLHRHGIRVDRMVSDRDDLWNCNLPRVTEYDEEENTPYSFTGLGVNLQITDSTVTINTYNFYTAAVVNSVTVPIVR